jgi:hypothetical protein
MQASEAWCRKGGFRVLASGTQGTCPLFNFPFSHSTPRSDGHCTLLRPNFGLRPAPSGAGLRRVNPPAAGRRDHAKCPDFSTGIHRHVLLPSAFPRETLRMENYQMTRGTNLVGRRFRGPRVPGSEHERGSRCTPCARYRDADRRISNRYKVRIEIAVTHSKQTRGTNSNRHKFRGLPARFSEGLPAEAFRVCEGGVRG